MSLETFLYHLHSNTDEETSANWEVDWEDRPLPYKLYQDVQKVPLPEEVMLTLNHLEATTDPTLRDIGHFLWYVFGLTQFCQSNIYTEDMKFTNLYRRFVPSGGGLYPNELYMYLKVEGLPTGMYHYDAAHHHLALLREGNFDSYVTKALGNRSDISACFGVVFVSTMFWKNFFKYHNFSYRLQGLDAGVLIGHLQEVTKRFGFTNSVHFQFLDQAMNHVLGLSEQEESVYAAVPLSIHSIDTWFHSAEELGDQDVTATELCEELPAIHHTHYVRSKTIAEFPLLLQMNEAAMLETIQRVETKQEQKKAHDGPVFALPRVKRMSYDFTEACQNRTFL